MNIPSNYLELTDSYNIPRVYATEYYKRKTNKKSVSQIIFELSQTMKVKENNISLILLDCLRKSKLEMIQSPSVISKVKIDSKTYMDNAREEIEKMLGNFKYPTYQPKPHKQSNRIAVAGDFHVPYHDEEALNRLLNDPAETLFIMGDVLDMLTANRHGNQRDFLSIKEELALGRALLEEFSRRFKKIYIISGNHDSAPIKRVKETLPHLSMLMEHPLMLLTTGLNNIEHLSTTISNTKPSTAYGSEHKINFLGQVGDCMLCHFDNFYGEEAPKQAEAFLQEWSHILKLKNQPRVILHGHNHRLGISFTPKGKVLISTGCFARPMPYQFDQHGKFKPPVVGYVAFNQDSEGNTILDSIQTIYLGS